MNCPFCKLDPKRNKILYEGKTVFVMPSNPRLVEGHLLVIPKRHIEKPSELTHEERRELMDVVLTFQEKIVKKVSTGCDIRQNFRPFQKQNDLKVDHIHFHLIPRNLNDVIYEKYEKIQRDVFHLISEEELDKTIGKLNNE